MLVFFGIKIAMKIVIINIGVLKTMVRMMLMKMDLKGERQKKEMGRKGSPTW